jgi:hypothetical protein
MKKVQLAVFSTMLLMASFAVAQQKRDAGSGLPAVMSKPGVPFSSIAADEAGNPLSGAVSITFSLYSSQRGGEPLWREKQNDVQLDAGGHYSAQLGETTSPGMPARLFTGGEARWLGVEISGQAEQPRVLLVSVPYAVVLSEVQIQRAEIRDLQRRLNKMAAALSSISVGTHTQE